MSCYDEKQELAGSIKKLAKAVSEITNDGSSASPDL